MFTKEEAQAAIQLFDIATKAWWLNVAEAALLLSKKLQDHFKEELMVDSEEKKED